jgi:hypothetical protein
VRAGRRGRKRRMVREMVVIAMMGREERWAVRGLWRQ